MFLGLWEEDVQLGHVRRLQNVTCLWFLDYPVETWLLTSARVPSTKQKPHMDLWNERMSE